MWSQRVVQSSKPKRPKRECVQCENLILLSSVTKVYPEEFKEGRVSAEVAKNQVCHRWIPKTSQVLTPGLVMAAAGQRFVYVSSPISPGSLADHTEFWKGSN